MTPSRPYLLRAINEWILDNQLTPYLLVDAEQPGVEVPRQFVENGKIVLNINPQAVQDLHLGNEALSFNARFQGKPWQIHIPIEAVLAIYAQENGRGMMFSEEEGNEPPPSDDGQPPRGGRPSLKVVK
ncbi:ClpXP protease specificity-enhancing factor [Thiohalobacter sp. IOR34]|uniref:ClpXP protease specificity-enhancing factor n=1 Tax=Thiohalobacter sp. IOR34 TaxID=3057176 RepID=UPI0025B0A521|nr:ClpXP protease specificity-enhancing factor [Thiohalobacter sp. IOR34]WJW74835.1 ClpXP protease specificity-enhancing factor [Thiohalobacter sp. IOR34]